jgi:glycerol uptake facilitator-like aquaporin
VEPSQLKRSLMGEFLGTALLLATVVGSGIMAERLAGGNGAIALFGNTLPTGAILIVLITAFGETSDAHFNPAVTLAFLMRREIASGVAFAYIAAQILGALTGMLAAHIMFDVSLFQISEKVRTGPAQWFSEAVATFGLLLTIFGTLRNRPQAVPFMVGAYITAAYWFTASTSFANPAVTIARAFTNSFSGIAPAHAPAFIAAQLIGALLATLLSEWLFASPAISALRKKPQSTVAAE